MTCEICKCTAILEPSSGDYLQINCKNCGPYKLSGTVVELIKGKNLNIPEMQKMLTSKQKHEEIPLITSEVVIYA